MYLFILKLLLFFRGVYICGHSAGAQLAAMMLSVDWMKEYMESYKINGKSLRQKMDVGIREMFPLKCQAIASLPLGPFHLKVWWGGGTEDN